MRLQHSCLKNDAMVGVFGAGVLIDRTQCIDEQVLENLLEHNRHQIRREALAVIFDPQPEPISIIGTDPRADPAMDFLHRMSFLIALGVSGGVSRQKNLGELIDSSAAVPHGLKRLLSESRFFRAHQSELGTR